MSDAIDPGCCVACGGLVHRARMLTGTKYSIPVADPEMWAAFAKRDDIDQFIVDRLRRAERIIVDLRKKLDEKCTNGQ